MFNLVRQASVFLGIAVAVGTLVGCGNKEDPQPTASMTLTSNQVNDRIKEVLADQRIPASQKPAVIAYIRKLGSNSQ